MFGKAPDVGMFKYMEASTIHITQADAGYLERDEKCGEVIVISTYPEGFFISISDTMINFGDLSDSFKSVYTKAYKAGSYILRLDCDAVEHDDLPKNKW
jgi:hypothetical protein